VLQHGIAPANPLYLATDHPEPWVAWYRVVNKSVSPEVDHIYILPVDIRILPHKSLILKVRNPAQYVAVLGLCTLIESITYGLGLAGWGE